MFGEPRLDFRRFDAKAPHLHLPVGTPDDFDRAIQPIAALIAGAVDAVAVAAGTEWIWGKALPCQRLVSEIAARQAGSAHHDFAALPDACLLPGTVQHQQLHGVNAPANRDHLQRSRIRLPSFDLMPAHGLRRLGGAVEIHAAH